MVLSCMGTGRAHPTPNFLHLESTGLQKRVREQWLSAKASWWQGCLSVRLEEPLSLLGLERQGHIGPSGVSGLWGLKSS